MTSGDSAVITIEKLIEGGWGLGRRDSGVLLVRGVIPGEQVSLAEEHVRKGYREAKLNTILKSSSGRVTAPCPVYGVCGGCQLQHISYEMQLQQKAAMLQETLRRVGKIEVADVPTPIASPESLHYRSTARFVVFRDDDAFRLGFHQEGTHRPVSAAECVLVPRAMKRLVDSIGSRFRAVRRLPVRLESLEIRQSRSTGSALLIYRVEGANRTRAAELFDVVGELPDVVGQVCSTRDQKPGQRWVRGKDWIPERLGEMTFRISDRSFMQANWPLTEMLSSFLIEWAGPSRGMRILELFAGIGIFGLPLARRGALLTAVEANRYALADARAAAKANHIGRCRFRHVRAEEMLKAVGGGEYDLAIVDPPRTGISDVCLEELLRIEVPRLLYVSCNAPTLARDLGRLCAARYRITRLQPFDMFPQTAQLETLVELVQQDRVCHEG